MRTAKEGTKTILARELTQRAIGFVLLALLVLLARLGLAGIILCDITTHLLFGQ